MPLKFQVDVGRPQKSGPRLNRVGNVRGARNPCARLFRLLQRLRSRGVGAILRQRPRPARAPAPRGYHLKLVLTTLGMALAYWGSATYLQLYLDQQPVTSIQNSRWYFVTKWNPQPPTRGELSVYREFMQPLLAAPQLQEATYLADDARKDQPFYLTQQLERLRTQWQDYVVAGIESQSDSLLAREVSLAFSAQPPVPQTQLTLTRAGSASGTASRNGFARGSLIPSDQLSLPRGAARDVPFQLYVLRNEQLITAFPAQQRFVKYVVGYRGDVVLIFPHAIYVNNVWVRDTPAPVAQQLRLHSTLDPLRRAYRVVQLQAGQYWVMGDDPDSIDSAYFGRVAREQFVGKVAWHF